MKNSNTFVKMIGLFISIFIYILSCLGGFIRPAGENIANSSKVNYSSVIPVPHNQNDKYFNVSQILSNNATFSNHENLSNRANKMSFQNEIPISDHSKTKRLIAEPSASPSEVLDFKLLLMN